MISVLLLFGTRPEAIKLAPLIHELRRDPFFDVKVCVTGQHRQMLAQVLDLFGIRPDIDLDLMTEGQQPADVAARVLRDVGGVVGRLRPDLVVVQGDTTSAFATAVAAYYAGIDVAHVEAGMRSGNRRAPWPEEANRRMISAVARLHFAATDDARANLLREGVVADRVHVTGNTGIDALKIVAAGIESDAALRQRIENDLPFLSTERRLILVTGHRRESFGRGIESICTAISEIAREHDDVDIVYPVHLNPEVREPVRRMLEGRERIHLADPLDYASFVHLMTRCHFILTDSGGIQEEAPSLGKPVLVMRENTERPEGVRAGNARVVGVDSAGIVDETRLLLRDRSHYEAMSRPTDIYGDGAAAARIAQILRTAAPREGARR